MSRVLAGSLVVVGEGAPSRRAGSADAEIGRKIRLIRSGQRLTQEAMAERLGLSIQQVQKYESGATRISASRLVEVARVLNVDVGTLLASADSLHGERSENTVINTAIVDTTAREASARELLELVQAFCAMRNGEARTRVLEMAKFLAQIERR